MDDRTKAEILLAARAEAAGLSKQERDRAVRMFNFVSERLEEHFALLRLTETPDKEKTDDR